MTSRNVKQNLVLGIAATSRGFGFAVLEGENTLVNWGTRRAKRGDSNATCVLKAKLLIAHYKPDVVVMEDSAAPGFRRSSRVEDLVSQLVNVARDEKIKVKQFSRDQVLKGFFSAGDGTKHGVAELLATLFPADLGPHLPPKRREWMNEDPRMDIFEATGLAVHFLRDRRAQSERLK